MKIPKIKSIWHPYWKWECFKHGFYAPVSVGAKTQSKEDYAMFLGDLERFNKGIEGVFARWQYSSEHFLTKEHINRVAWLGQASCCWACGLSSYNRSGFYLLSQKEQSQANKLAETKIIEYIKIKNNENPIHGQQLYFKMD